MFLLRLLGTSSGVATSRFGDSVVYRSQVVDPCAANGSGLETLNPDPFHKGSTQQRWPANSRRRFLVIASEYPAPLCGSIACFPQLSSLSEFERFQVHFSDEVLDQPRFPLYSGQYSKWHPKTIGPSTPPSSSSCLISSDNSLHTPSASVSKPSVYRDFRD